MLERDARLLEFGRNSLCTLLRCLNFEEFGLPVPPRNLLLHVLGLGLLLFQLCSHLLERLRPKHGVGRKLSLGGKERAHVPERHVALVQDAPRSEACLVVPRGLVGQLAHFFLVPVIGIGTKVVDVHEQSTLALEPNATRFAHQHFLR